MMTLFTEEEILEMEKTYFEALDEAISAYDWDKREMNPARFYDQFIMKKLCWSEEHLKGFKKGYDDLLKEIERRCDEKVRRMIEDSRKAGVARITPSLVAKGLRYLLSMPKDTPRDELAEGLLECGCNFTLEDINRQFPEGGYLLEGIRAENTACMASIIPNVILSDYGHCYFYDQITHGYGAADAIRQFANTDW